MSLDTPEHWRAALVTSLGTDHVIDCRGKISPATDAWGTMVIDRTYRLDEIVEARRYADTGRKTGKVVITFGPRRPQPA